MPTSFAVVITNYNYARFVCEAVDSVLAQTRGADRIVVVDDGSTDDSAEVLRGRYGDDARVSLVFSANGGQLGAFALGVAQCAEDVVSFLDADDAWKPDYLEQLGRLYDVRPDIDFVFSNLHRFGNDHGIEAFAHAAEDFGYTAIITYLTGQWYGASTSAISLRLKMARRSTDMPADIVNMWRISADACVIMASGVFGARKYYLPTNSVRYRVHGDNGWYGKSTPASAYRGYLSQRLTMNYCARLIGMEQNCAALLPLEFATKPAPSAEERARYERLIGPPRGTPGPAAGKPPPPVWRVKA